MPRAEHAIDFANRDCHQPRSEACPVLQGRDAVHGVDEGVLHDVIEIAIAAEQPKNDSCDVAGIPSVEEPIRVDVVPAQPVDELDVVDGRSSRCVAGHVHMQ